MSVTKESAKQRPPAHDRHAQEAATLLGSLIRLGRTKKKWSQSNLAERMNISRATLQKLEKGDMRCALGLYFEAASLVQVKFFLSDRIPILLQLDYAKEISALLPQRVCKKANGVLDDDF